jgi:phage terminase large subunit-like protein
MSHTDDVDRYIKGVLDGSIITGRLERLAVHRHVADLELAGARGFYFDKKCAIKAIDFSRMCRQFQSPFAGQPLELRLDQKFFVWCVFGWRQNSNGLRRFRQARYELGRKGGKSTLCAYLACLLIFWDKPVEKGGEGYVAATQSGQAAIVWKAARHMIEASPALRKRAHITPYKTLIEYPANKFEFRPLSFDKTPDGLNASFIIKDEEHAYREIHRSQFDTLDSGSGTRQQPLTITITTYGNSESIIWQESHEYGVRCLESVISGDIVDDTWYVFTCALDFPKEQPCFRCKGDECPWCDGSGVIPPDDPYDETIWRKANPGIGPGVGYTPKLEAVQDFARMAANRPDKQAEFYQKMLNIVVSSRNKLILPEAWDACRGDLSHDWSQAERIHGGFDLARCNDMAGAAVVARFDMVDDSGADFYRFEIRSRAWTCEDRHQDVKTPQVARWIREGRLEESTGNQILFSDVEDWVVEMSNLYNVATWAYDPQYGAILAQRIQEIHNSTIFKFTQSSHFYTGPVGRLESLVSEVHMVNGQPVRALVHDGDPVLSWMMTNLMIHKNYRGQKMPDKSSDANKIDIAVAVLMAISECLYSNKASVGKYYETHDVEFV